MKKQRFIASIIEIVLGIILVVCCISGIIEDAYWNGMGTALIVVGVLQLIRHIRYKTNDDYRENVDIEVNDERNKYLSMKAWSWAGYLFVLIVAVAAIILKIYGQDDMVHLASGSVCVIMLLYWGSYMILRRKY